MDYAKYIAMLDYCLKKKDIGLSESINKCKKLKNLLLQRKELDKSENNKEINQILENDQNIQKIDKMINNLLNSLTYYFMTVFKSEKQNKSKFFNKIIESIKWQWKNRKYVNEQAKDCFELYQNCFKNQLKFEFERNWIKIIICVCIFIGILFALNSNGITKIGINHYVELYLPLELISRILRIIVFVCFCALFYTFGTIIFNAIFNDFDPRWSIFQLMNLEKIFLLFLSFLCLIPIMLLSHIKITLWCKVFSAEYFVFWFLNLMIISFFLLFNSVGKWNIGLKKILMIIFILIYFSIFIIPNSENQENIKDIFILKNEITEYKLYEVAHCDDNTTRICKTQIVNDNMILENYFLLKNAVITKSDDEQYRIDLKNENNETLVFDRKFVIE